MSPRTNPEQKALNLPGDLYGLSTCKKKHDTASYVWLAYSIFFFVEPLLRKSLSYWLHQLPYYAVFLALYVAYVEFERTRTAFSSSRRSSSSASPPSRTNAGGSSFFIYVAAMLPFCVESPRVLYGVMLAEIATLALEYRIFPTIPTTTSSPASSFSSSASAISSSHKASGPIKSCAWPSRRMKPLSPWRSGNASPATCMTCSATPSASSSSRQSSPAVCLAAMTARDNARAIQEIADVERTARTALAEVREAIGGYRSKGLTAEVEQARLTLDAAGVALECESRPPSLRPNEETVLSLAVREAVTNIVRHARRLYAASMRLRASHCRRLPTPSS